MARITGNSSNNTLRSNVEADIIDGGAGIDTVDYSLSTKAITIDLRAPSQSGGDAQGDVLISIENIIGTKFDDKLIGDKFDNVFDGGEGADRIDLGDGNDTVISRFDQSVDTYLGGVGVDTLDYSFNTVNFHLVVTTINLDQGTTSRQIVGLEGPPPAPTLEDKFSGFENVLGSQGRDRIIGDGADNRLEGNGGNDFLVGGKGADTIVGGLGRDVMHGFDVNQPQDFARDTFVFNAVEEIGLGAGEDAILGFEFGVDKVSLVGVDANTLLAGNQDFHFSTAFGQFDGTAGALIVSVLPSVAGSGVTNYSISGDTNGDSIADFSLSVSGFASVNGGILTTSDFIL